MKKKRNKKNRASLNELKKRRRETAAIFRSSLNGLSRSRKPPLLSEDVSEKKIVRLSSRRLKIVRDVATLFDSLGFANVNSETFLLKIERNIPSSFYLSNRELIRLLRAGSIDQKMSVKKMEKVIIAFHSSKRKPKKAKRKPKSRKRLTNIWIDDLEKCEHGVPRGKICAICDPKRFKKMADLS